MNVLSLFDGMSCGQLALKRAGIPVDNYFASEIDKHAIKVTQHNFPNTIQLGSVVDVDGYKLPKIDLLIGGSPCQSFSFAGKRKGMSTKCETEILTLDHYLELKNEGYEFEGQSYLFWEYMRLLNEVKPKYFLLENVIMGEKWEKVLSKAIGVKPIEINSALVSAQNRRRLYWTNIGMQPMGLFGDLESIIQQPKDKGILLRDILETDVPEKYYLSNKIIKGFLNHNEVHKKRGNGFEFKPKELNEKSSCLNARYHKMGVDDTYIAASRGRNPENPKSRQVGLETEQMLELRYDGKTNCLTSVQKDNLVMHIPEATKKGYAEIKPGECFDFENPKSETRRGRKMEGKSNCLMAKKTDFMHYTNDFRIRRLTPIECERLQTVPDNYTNHVSDTQRYRMLGNGWTVDVISHIFSYICPYDRGKYNENNPDCSG